jgi:hypothetical protein
MSSGTALKTPADSQLDPTGAVGLSDEDRTVVQNVDRALADALCLKKWWEQKENKRDYAQCFDLVRTFNAPNRGMGFFDTAPVSTGDLRIMGVLQEMCFDQPKHAARDELRNEFREFLLGYFTRVSSFQEPEAFTAASPPKLPPGLEFLSWFPEDLDTRVGFGYSQLYYKLKDSGLIGKVPEQNRFAIFDLREIKQKYEWLVMKVQVFNFNLAFRPFGPRGLSLVLPLKEETYLVLSPDFIRYCDNPTPNLAGRYGFGYALMKRPSDDSIFAYGPGHFGVGFQLIEFDVQKSGEVVVRMVFVVNRPQRILRIDIDPIDWTLKIADRMSLGIASRLFAPVKRVLDQLPLRLSNFDPITTYVSLANALTAGEAARQLGISIEELEKSMLTQHFMEHYRMVVASLLTWRQIPDWLDRNGLPEWAITGLGR